MSNAIVSFFKRKLPQSVKWEEVREEILSSIEGERDGLALIEPFEYEDAQTEQKIRVKVSPYYSRLSVDDREYYFERETGKFDGTGYTPNNH